jgi:hypothetical protein
MVKSSLARTLEEGKIIGRRKKTDIIILYIVLADWDSSHTIDVEH